MRFDNLKQDKGVAGMNILIGLVISIFILAILVMSIALLGNELQDAVDDGSTAQGVINNSTNDISGVTEWFTIFIVMGAIVVIMLLVAIIIQVAKGFQGGSGGFA